jgi:2-hydroxy-6-oxonona-2,4-dienedioate hydrolase
MTMSAITEASTSKFAKVSEGPLKNFKIHYNDAGSGEAVVMMHGSGPGASGWSNFSRNVEPLVNAGYRVLLVDSPGWNKSDPIVVKEGSRNVHNAAAVMGVLDTLDIKTAHLIGNSMGGGSALELALTYPDRLGRLVIMGGRAGGPSLFVPGPPEGIKRLTETYVTPTMEKLAEMLNVFVYDPSKLTDELIKSRLNNMLEHREHLENFVTSMRSNPRDRLHDISLRVPEIKAKTLITWGRDDRFVPLDAGLKLLWLLPNARMHVFSQCGHWAQWEHAEEFNRLIISFFEH